MRWSELLVPVLLLALASPLLADDPEVERAIRRQNELAVAKEADQLLKEARDGVARGDTAESRFLLGRALELLGKFDLAHQQYEQALERDPTCAYAYLGLGIFHVRKGNTAEAEKQLRNALQLDEKLSLARLELAALLADEGEPDGAIRVLLALLGYAPKNAHARHLLADLYYWTNRFEKAVHEYKALLELDPKAPKVEKMLLMALVRLSRNEEAAELAARLIESEPEDPDPYRMLARVQLGMGEDEKAIATLERLVGVLPEGSELIRETRAEIARIRRGEAGADLVSAEALIRDLGSDVVEVRRRAMRTLIQYEMVPPPKAMLAALTDEDKLMRVYAVRYLGRIRWRRSVWFLEMLLVHPEQRDPAQEVRGQAARSLATSGYAVAIPILIDALRDESDYVFRIVVESLRTLTGRCFAGDPTVPPKPEERDALRERWTAWWRGPRALSAKLDAIDDIEAFTDPRFRTRFLLYLFPLLTDAERIVAARARKGFETLTGRLPGKEEDLETMEGRQRIRKAAMDVLDEIIGEKGEKPGKKKPG